MHTRNSCTTISTKARTLQALAPLVRTAHIDPGLVLTLEQWKQQTEEHSKRLQRLAQSRPMIVRSSSAQEDNWLTSAAGRYLSSVLEQDSTGDQIKLAVDAVFDSYDDQQADNEVFIQTYIDDVHMAIVATTRVAHTGAPYYVFAVDDSSSDSASITAGKTIGHKTWYVHREKRSSGPDETVNQLLATAREVEQILDHDTLELELLVDGDRRLHLLQARPLVLNSLKIDRSDGRVNEALISCRRDLDRSESAESSGSPARYLNRFYSNMADWNPAEMIGQRPRPLALSMYMRFITDSVWAEQRYEFGYKDLRGTPLLQSFAGQPYIDVGASLLSFIPGDFPEFSTKIVVNHQLEQLLEDPLIHDRIEFDVAIPSTTFNIEDRLAPYAPSLLDAATVRTWERLLARSTQRAMDRLHTDVAAVQRARRTRERLLQEHSDPLQRLTLLLRHIRPSISLPFAHVARGAFIATSFVRSARARDLATQESVENFMMALGTVSARIRDEGALVAKGLMDWDDYVRKYGDLRPGTYDATVPKYKDDPEVYLLPFVEGEGITVPPLAASDHNWLTADTSVLHRRLKELHLTCSPSAFVAYTHAAITAREEGKFELSAWVSAAIDALLEIGADCGQSPDDVSFWRLDDPIDQWASTRSIAEHENVLAQRRLDDKVSQLVHLPATMETNADLECFLYPAAHPNYVGSSGVIGRVAIEPVPTDDVSGIVVIASADPGYEWIFARPIQGLVTAYGGANSHMAVRCAEAGIPAAIGVGEQSFEELLGASVVRLDCAAQIIEVLG